MRIGKIIHFWLLKEKHFVLLDPLTRPVKNPINIFIISSKIVFIMFFSLNVYGYLTYGKHQ